ncbi:hypothetical protein HAALTHF_21140n [Vreelandella aquamarina]|nr:hypothetical protein HAALTHF_21140n [Halomonas axialensis]
METQARRYVEFQIRMVHTMQAPEPGHCMKDAMLKVDCEIKRDRPQKD